LGHWRTSLHSLFAGESYRELSCLRKKITWKLTWARKTFPRNKKVKHLSH
jgi:CHASE3 domain sensor protein